MHENAVGRREISAFGLLLREYRQAAGLSQEELAERAGLSTRGISDLERGARTVPRMETVRMLADGLGLQDADRADLLAARNTSPHRVSAIRSVRAGTLPVPSTPLVGRENEVNEIAGLVQRADVRLVTLTGPGGVGKTRLALEVAHQVANRFPDGVLFIDLTPVRDPALVLPTIAAATGVRDNGSRPLIDVLTSVFQDRALLLVLDNLEQVVEAGPDIAMLLSACPLLTILDTSRVRLRLAAEHLFPVLPLRLPAANVESSPNNVGNTEAVALFVDRAQAADPTFTLTELNSGTIASLVERLEGLPLAIELAAARITVMPPETLLLRLEQRLPLLTGGPRDAPARQRTMRDAIAWSYDLLTQQEQLLLRRLAVFVGGFTIEAAEAVFGAGADALEGIASLVDNSLLRALKPTSGEGRFDMLETVREFGIEQLAATAEDHLVRQYHAAYFLAFATHIRPRIESADGLSTLRTLEAEHDNLRAALTWLITENEAEMALRLSGALWKFWLVRGQFREGRRWLERALQLPGDVSDTARMEVFYGLSAMVRIMGDAEKSEAICNDMMRLSKAAEDTWNIARSHYILGVLRANRHDVTGIDLVRQALQGAVEVGDQHMQAMALSGLGQILWERGEHIQAISLTQQALSIWRERGDIWGIAAAQASLGDMMSETDDARALIAYKESLRHYATLEDKGGIADSLVRIAQVAVRHHYPSVTAMLLGAAEAIRADAGIGHAPARHADTREPADAARETLSDADYTEAWHMGKRSTMDQTITEAMQVRTGQHPDSATSAIHGMDRR